MLTPTREQYKILREMHNKNKYLIAFGYFKPMIFLWDRMGEMDPKMEIEAEIAELLLANRWITVSYIEGFNIKAFGISTLGRGVVAYMEAIEN